MKELPRKALPVHPCPVCGQATKGFWPVFTADRRLEKAGCRDCFAFQYRRDCPGYAADFLARVEEFYLRSDPSDP
ncbi:MAG: hypothetical protein KME03_13370 [Aphanocapsa lilacina HA4352-LM1]|nr:hypothetical protein [Aphanocapsa lilacina HA4352-LM1]